ncbi:MAG: hypothetical protein WD042_14105 [Phycisphaeraceae bacterium]
MDAAQPARLLGGIVNIAGRTWFIKALDDPTKIAPHVEAFTAFVDSFEVGAQEQPPGAAAASPPPAPSAAASAPPQMAWDLPAGWQQHAQPSAMLLAEFTAQHASQDVRITVSSFPGDVGGMLANINRWRGQLGLPPVAKLEDQPTSGRTVAGLPASWVDLTARQADAGSEPQRMIAVTLPRQGMTWFIKAAGPRDAVEKTLPALEQFLKSLRFGA